MKYHHDRSLDNNPFKSFDPRVLSSLSAMQFLSLANLSIVELPLGIFDRMPHLQQLFDSEL